MVRADEEVIHRRRRHFDWSNDGYRHQNFIGTLDLPQYVSGFAVGFVKPHFWRTFWAPKKYFELL